MYLLYLINKDIKGSVDILVLNHDNFETEGKNEASYCRITS